MPQSKASSITASHIRVTQLDATGKFVTTPAASFTMTSFVSVSFTPEYEDGDEFTQKNAAGEVCSTFKAADTLKRVNLSIAICNPDPEFTNLIAGGKLLGTAPDAQGWSSPKVGADPLPNGVAIEVWSKVAVDGKPAGTNPYYHWVFPYAKMRDSGERVLQNDMLATEFEGWGVGNLGFNAGPGAPLWPFPADTDSPYAYARTATVPVGTGLTTATNKTTP